MAMDTIIQYNLVHSLTIVNHFLSYLSSVLLHSRISTNEGNEVGANVLSYSGAVVLGAQQIAWTGQSGMLVFVLVRNHSDREWRGYPEGAVYTINKDNTRGELISTGKGILTNYVNREDFIPTDELKFIPANSERESLTFIPVDFSGHPLVYVYWRFVDDSNVNVSFRQTIANPKVQPLVSLSEARTLLERE